MTVTCGGCDSTWTARNAAHCSGCHRTFTGVSGFDIHRSHGQCVDPATITRKDGQRLLTPNARGLWSQAGVKPHPRAVRECADRGQKATP